MAKARDLTLISVSPVASIETGDTMHQVAFGNYVKVTDKIAKRIQQQSEKAVLPNEIPINELILIMDFAALEPYTIGSKWKLEIEESSKELKLTKTGK